MFTLYMIKTANSLFGHSDNAAMFSFGEFFSLEGETSNYSVWYGLVHCCMNIRLRIHTYIHTYIHGTYIYVNIECITDLNSLYAGNSTSLF